MNPEPRQAEGPCYQDGGCPKLAECENPLEPKACMSYALWMVHGRVVPRRPHQLPTVAMLALAEADTEEEGSRQREAIKATLKLAHELDAEQLRKWEAVCSREQFAASRASA